MCTTKCFFLDAQKYVPNQNTNMMVVEVVVEVMVVMVGFEFGCGWNTLQN